MYIFRASAVVVAFPIGFNFGTVFGWSPVALVAYLLILELLARGAEEIDGKLAADAIR